MERFTFQLVSSRHCDRFHDYFAAHDGFYVGQELEVAMMARMQQHDVHALVAYRAGRPVGCVEYVYEPRRPLPGLTADFFMRTLRATTVAFHQRTGVGQGMFSELFDRARREGVRTVWLHNAAPSILAMVDKFRREKRRFAPFEKGRLPPPKETFHRFDHLPNGPHVLVKIRPNPQHPVVPRPRFLWRKPALIP